jgi:transposase, IS5 family
LFEILKQSKYAHAKQFKRSRKAIRKLRTQLGRVIRDIERKCGKPGEKLKNLLLLGNRLYLQKREDRGKVYSLHEPAVECVAKGKAHKPYEFGCKVGLVISARKNWILGAHALHGNPFDGHTLKTSIAVTERNTGVQVRDAFVDRGYRGADHHPSHHRMERNYLKGRVGDKINALLAASAFNLQKTLRSFSATGVKIVQNHFRISFFFIRFA